MTTTPSSPGAPITDKRQLVEYLGVLWKQKWVILLVALLGPVAAYVWTMRQPRIYQADCLIEYDPNPPKPLGREVEDTTSPMMLRSTRPYSRTR